MSQGAPTLDPTQQQPAAPSPPRPQASNCPCRGHFTLRPTAKAHRLCRYRLGVLTLPTRLLMPTCSPCKHSILSFDAVPELAATLKAEYRAQLSHRAATEITFLGGGCSQRQLEIRLALLSNKPRRLEELNTYWALPLPAEPSPSTRK